eukprot:PhF_6_TR21011/c1_g2_i1/m.30185
MYYVVQQVGTGTSQPSLTNTANYISVPIVTAPNTFSSFPMGSNHVGTLPQYTTRNIPLPQQVPSSPMFMVPQQQPQQQYSPQLPQQFHQTVALVQTPQQQSPAPTAHQSGGGTVCYSCGGVGHKKMNCPNKFMIPPPPPLAPSSYPMDPPTPLDSLSVVICSIHGKSRTLRNMAYNHELGVWCCLPHTVCRNLLLESSPNK